ncbi:MAG: RNA-binding transcriptional accessory protein [Gemmatimonadota bacterium]|nr:MAG: RNA-binding transcriptional accessory protein [Gemmatimonadota bacterium]
MNNLIPLLTQKTNLKPEHVGNILSLLEEGATIPFIARYRKEMTGGASDEQLREFDEIYSYSKKLLERKAEILRLIEERGRLDEKIQKSIEEATTLTELEDLYRPYKEKKNTRAGLAMAKGLEPLADLLQSAALTLETFQDRAKGFVNDEVVSVDEAIQGAQDIVAERYSDDAKEREILRRQAQRSGVLEVKPGKEFDSKGGYTHYEEHSERIAHIPSHRYLAITRGAREKQLSVKIDLNSERIEENIRKFKIPKNARSSNELLFAAYQDGLKRLLLPSLEREMHRDLKERADRQAIALFGKNLVQLLMTPPVTGRVIMGVDPAYRTGCKLAVIDENGKFLDHGVIFPTSPQNDYEGSKKRVLELVEKYNVNGVAIGNGTASRETQEFFARLNREDGRRLKYTVVSEAGASVYSASKVGQEEYPDLDVTVRGAISIAQRLRDPMAALVKIDPKSLGIGQYQHDVDQKLLERKLHETTEDLVNRVGVDVNSASASLLAYVAGIGPKMAKSIVAHREKNGPFMSKMALLNVKGLGAKAFEQCAGFLRIRNGESILDNTGVHPESYDAARKLLKHYDVHAIGQEETERIAAELGIGPETLEDIIKELQKPGFDPRQELPEIPFRDDVTDISMLKEGSIVSGVVRSIVDFGAFVDIGLKNDGLIHISQLSSTRISHPLEILSVNQYLPQILVIAVDPKKGKVSLSLRQ